jgi:hypothetical protein
MSDFSRGKNFPAVQPETHSLHFACFYKAFNAFRYSENRLASGLR